MNLSNQITTMSSREIAELTGKRHPDVKRDILNMLKDLSEDASKFAHNYLDSQNRTQTEYRFDRDHKKTFEKVFGSQIVLVQKMFDQYADENGAYPFDVDILDALFKDNNLKLDISVY
jgi:phage regulator Rha-like protein